MSTRRLIFLVFFGVVVGMICGTVDIPLGWMVVYLSITIPVLRWSLGSIRLIRASTPVMTRSA